MGFQHVMPWRAQGGGPPIQSGVAEIASDETFVSVTISPVDIGKAVVEFSVNGTTNDTSPKNCFITGQLTNPTTVLFQRYGSADPVVVYITWFIWQGATGSPITVYRGSAQVGFSTALPVNVTIPAVDLNHAFPIITSRANHSSFPDDKTPVRAKLTSSTNLELNKNINSDPGFPESHTVEYQIIENPNWDVQQFDITMSGLTLDQPITAIPSGQIFLAASTIWNRRNTAITGQYLPIFWQTTSTNIHFERFNSLDDWLISLYCINTNGDFTTQHIIDWIASGFSYKNFSLATIDLTKTFIKINSIFQMLERSDTPNLSIDSFYQKMDFISSIQGRSSRNIVYGQAMKFSSLICEIA